MNNAASSLEMPLLNFKHPLIPHGSARKKHILDKWSSCLETMKIVKN